MEPFDLNLDSGQEDSGLDSIMQTIQGLDTTGGGATDSRVALIQQLMGQSMKQPFNFAAPILSFMFAPEMKAAQEQAQNQVKLKNTLAQQTLMLKLMQAKGQFSKQRAEEEKLRAEAKSKNFEQQLMERILGGGGMPGMPGAPEGIEQLGGPPLSPEEQAQIGVPVYQQGQPPPQGFGMPGMFGGQRPEAGQQFDTKIKVGPLEFKSKEKPTKSTIPHEIISGVARMDIDPKYTYTIPEETWNKLDPEVQMKVADFMEKATDRRVRRANIEADNKRADAALQANNYWREESLRLRGEAEAEKKQRELEKPAGGDTFLHPETGEQYVPATKGDIIPGSTRYAQNSVQAKNIGAARTLNAHIHETLDNLAGLAKGDSNKLNQFLTTKIKDFENNPQTYTLFKFLGPATALALAGVYKSMQGGGQGSSGQGLLGLSKMLESAFVSPSSTGATSLHAMRAGLKLIQKSMVENKVNPAQIKETKDTIELIEAIARKAKIKLPESTPLTQYIDKLTSMPENPIYSSPQGPVIQPKTVRPRE